MKKKLNGMIKKILWKIMLIMVKCCFYLKRSADNMNTFKEKEKKINRSIWENEKKNKKRRKKSNKKKLSEIQKALLYRHWFSFPGRCQPSIVNANELNFRVRNGNGCDLTAISTDFHFKTNKEKSNVLSENNWTEVKGKALDRLVLAGWTHHCAYTLSLSNS